MLQGLDKLGHTSTEILRKIFDQSSEGFQVIDKDWKYLYVNKTVAMQGMSTVEELTGHTMMERYPGIEKTPLFKQLKRSMDDKVAIKMDNEFIFPNGQRGWFQLFIHPWTEGIIIFSIDITSRRLSERKLLEKVEQCRGAATTEGDRKNIEEVKQAIENFSKPTVTVIG